jgi:hypothetical protein
VFLILVLFIPRKFHRGRQKSSPAAILNSARALIPLRFPPPSPSDPETPEEETVVKQLYDPWTGEKEKMNESVVERAGQTGVDACASVAQSSLAYESELPNPSPVRRPLTRSKTKSAATRPLDPKQTQLTDVFKCVSSSKSVKVDRVNGPCSVADSNVASQDPK